MGICGFDHKCFFQVIRFDGGEFVFMAGEFNELHKVSVAIKRFPQREAFLSFLSSCSSFCQVSPNEWKIMEAMIRKTK